jgi:hypothetical protein
MSGSTLDLEQTIQPDYLAAHIARKWEEWNSLRQTWVEEIKEIRHYVYATDTTTTTNSLNPWRNTTAIPKVTQIYDNLKANYMSALFPNSKWLRWEGADNASEARVKKKTIQSYIYTKVRQSGFEQTIDRLISDFIEVGNCFGIVDYVTDVHEDAFGGQTIRYKGPKLFRISPYDIVFDPTAIDFKSTPKVVRSLLNMGEVKKLILNGDKKYHKVFKKMRDNRSMVGSAQGNAKGEAYVADGFSDITAYYQSGQVEVLTFYGDIYNMEKDIYMPNHIVTVVDRAYVIQTEVNPTWLGGDNIFHAGWRDRPDNLYAQGPLANLIGMQYRLNHLD